MRGWGSFLAAGWMLFAAGCVSKPPVVCPPMPPVTVNNHSATLVLDTGSPFTWFYQKSAKRIGLESGMVISNLPINGGPNREAFLSKPVTLAMGTNSFDAQFVVCDPGWWLRLGLELDGIEGLVGWTQVRDNVLVFDPDHRTISGTNQVPDPARSWLKLGVSEQEQLWLTTRLPDGRMGSILVDTGSPDGVSLPEAEWQKWVAAHPKARVKKDHIILPGIGLQATHVAWADEIQLGNLRLTDVPVAEIPPIMGTNTNFYQVGLGRYAMSRMDLVVDFPNRVAYVNPRPPPGPPYSGSSRASKSSKEKPGTEGWVVTNGVEISQAELLLSAAGLKVNADDIDGAMADLTRALELDATNKQALGLRCGLEVQRDDFTNASADLERLTQLGLPNNEVFLWQAKIHLNQGDSAAALTDVQKVLNRQPRNPEAKLARAAARQMTDDFTGAAADFDDLAALGGGNSNYFRIAAAQLRMRTGALPPDFAPSIGGWKDAWFKMLGQYVAGQVSEEKLLEFAQKPHERPVGGQQCAAYYVIGEMRLARGDKEGAREWFEKCVGTKQWNYMEYDFAKGELGKMRGKN